jgi:hypothetical protein
MFHRETGEKAVLQVKSGDARVDLASLARLLPAGAVAGWDLHPLESAALSRRTPKADAGMDAEVVALRSGAHWPLRAMTLRNVSDPKKVRFATRRRASAL